MKLDRTTCKGKIDRQEGKEKLHRWERNHASSGPPLPIPACPRKNFCVATQKWNHGKGLKKSYRNHQHTHCNFLLTLTSTKTRHAERLQKKFRAEKQFNKQMASNGEARKSRGNYQTLS